ncbi:TetR/AcrR family transcriptional regulator [Nocardia sp. NBC_01503]|uniref:TetR/AcrR family transcriptional regulator n=1 Tax=Nocardia sp. NBC_01503 TaxID=2975997 RepID=UPI002E7BEEBD|nr:TetR/AcrR family transcriptional regulator [Nocardia sp. NBC_01503]WTL36134.1 TetR/AcrR family transcriptional regulator [Nocardia sp. NBC_01503]
MNVRAPARTWGGRTQEERRTERRRRLIGAALAIWLENGWAAVTMRGVCTAAGLNDRYFYEHFADRDELLAAVWDQVCFEVFGELSGVVAEHLDLPPLEILHEAIARAVALQVDSPARILFGDHAGSRVLEERRKTMLTEATDLLIATGRPYLRPGFDESDLRMGTLMGIGGFVELLTAWRTGAIESDTERIIDHVTRTANLLGARYLALPE